MAQLTGKTALVTGSTSGIGLGVARGLAAEGANIVINGFADEATIAAIVADIENDFGVKAKFIAADLTKGDDAINLVQETEKQFGAVDILFNNAGIQHVSPVEDFPADMWEKIISLNLSSSFYTTKAALPGMKDSGYGRIINLASVHGLVASPFKAAYVAAKHGVVGLTKTTGLEVAECPDITVNAICPGYVKTPLVEGQIKDQAKAHNMPEDQVIKDVILAAQPNKRFVEVEEIAALTTFLCTKNGLSFNGAAIPLEGGWSAR